MSTAADIDPIAKMLETLLTAGPVAHGGLTVVPLLGPTLAEPEWLTLTEAGDRVQVIEVDEAGSVCDLKVSNMADRPLLLLDGEEVVGAKQNRILNTTVLVAARAETTIPVSCVEQGRWGYRGRQFASSDASLFASVRQKKAAWVNQSVRAGRGPRSDQGAVWDELASKAAEHQVESPTAAMRDFYVRYEADLAGARRALAPIVGQVGAIVYISGRWAGAEILAGQKLFARAWTRLCSGYAADAIGRKPGAPLTPDPGDVLQRVAACPVEPAPAVGLGSEYRLTGPTIAGAALVVEDRLAHLMAFPAPATQ